MYPTLARIGEELDRAGRASGAGWWRTSRSIVLPLIRPALFSAFVLMFVEILNDYDPALFLVKPGNEVIGTTMLSQFIQGMVGPVAARLFKLGVTGGHDA